MKLIKKIAAIMLSVMMVLGMASVVSADGRWSNSTYRKWKDYDYKCKKGSDIYDLSDIRIGKLCIKATK